MVNKFKHLLIAASIIFIPLYGNTEKKTIITADPFPAERPGQYVYYHDTRKGVSGVKEPLNRLFGLMKADNKQYIIRVFDIKNSRSFLYLGHYILNNGNMEFLTDSIQGDVKEGTAIMAELLNLMNYLVNETIANSKKLNDRDDVTVNSVWESYKRKLVNSYKWWIPFYRLESSINAETDFTGEKNYTSLKLVCFGTVASNDPDMFTRISKLPVSYKNKIPEKKYAITAADKMNVKLDNISLRLDKNWHYEKGDPLNDIADCYILKNFSSRDAQIGVESIELNNIKIGKNIIDTFVSTLQYQSSVIADTVEIDLKNKTLSLSLWDADSGTATFTKYISLNVKKNLLTTLNFSALDFVYYGNIDYFNSILNADFNN